MDWYKIDHMLIDLVPDCSKGMQKVLRLFYEELIKELNEEKKIEETLNNDNNQTI
jgi:hypothetical protein